MTRKSHARQQRDDNTRQLEKLRRDPKMATVFDEIDGYYKTAIKAIVDYSEMGKQLIQFPELVPFLVSPAETRDAAITLSTDLKRFKQMFDNLRDMHKDKTGKPKNTDDMVLAIDMTQRYGELMESMNTVCAPVAQQLADDYQVAQDRFNIANGKEVRPIAQAMATGKDVKVVIEDGAPKVEIVDASSNMQSIEEVTVVDNIVSQDENTEKTEGVQ